MANTKKKTISGAMYSKPNLEHNLREHIPPNSVEEKRYLNLVYTKDADITLEQVYDKLFADSYKEWREKEIKKGRGKRFPETYYEKIKQDKQKHLTYEIIWQIGDMRDTGFNLNQEDADKAQALLDDFAVYLLDLPEVCVVTQKELDDPEWKPPFEAGLIVHHMTYHGDENSPHIHMTYIPYTTKIAGKYAKLEEVEQDLTDKTNEVERQVQKLDMLQEDADKVEKRVVLAEQIYDYFKDTSASEREHEYFERILELTYENSNLKAENQELKRENSRLREKLEKAYDFMRQFTIGGMNMLEKFLRSIGEWVQQKVAGMSR